MSNTPRDNTLNPDNQNPNDKRDQANVNDPNRDQKNDGQRGQQQAEQDQKRKQQGQQDDNRTGDQRDERKPQQR